MAGLINPRDLDRQITIQRKVPDPAPDAAGSETWATVEAGVWAQVQDMLPSRGERLADGIEVASRPARVRMRYREDVAPSMRFVMAAPPLAIVAGPPLPRIMQIVAGPAELGRREGLEFMVEDYSSAGNG
jgi:head-tail adaptor